MLDAPKNKGVKLGMVFAILEGRKAILEKR